MDLKEIFRKDTKKSLKRYIKIFAKSKHYKMFKNLEKILNYYHKFGARNILVFKPIDIEPNITKVIDKTRFNFYLPFMFDVSFKIVKYFYPFKEAKFNILQTICSNKVLNKIDIAIIPVVGVDKGLARIGHSKGYYDRYFNSLNYKPLIIFVSLKDCFIDKNLAAPYDIVGNFYITPKKIYYMWRGDVRVCYDIRCSTLRSVNRLYNRKKNK